MKLPIQSQPILRKVGTEKLGGGTPGVTASNKKWGCYYKGNEYKGDVDVWWSDDREAGTWACNAWKDYVFGCGNQCTAFAK